MSRPLVAIPVKPFGIAKRRLSAVLPEEVRPVVSRRLAQHTLEAVRASSASPLILSADDGVTRWAASSGAEVLLDHGSSLNEAADGAVRMATERGAPWAILHADLPLLRRDVVEEFVEHLQAGRAVLAASTDGGSSLVGGSHPVAFRYGPGSFHRHLAQLRHEDLVILNNVGLTLDLDQPEDLQAALGHKAGAWMADVVERDTVR